MMEPAANSLKNDSNETVASLTRTVTEIQEAADVASTSAREISSGNSDLSQRTEEQAAALEQTAASMEELTAKVHQNAENARPSPRAATLVRPSKFAPASENDGEWSSF